MINSNIKVLFVGSSPSRKNTISWIPFVGTKSAKTLKSWMLELGVQGKVMNAYPTVNHAQNISNLFRLKAAADRFDKIIALGDTAHKALLDANIEHFVLPHPSGLNRKLNDKQYVQQILDKCRIFLHSKNLKSEVIKHNKWKDVAFKVNTVWMGENVVLKGFYLNQGFDKTFFLILSNIQFKIEDIENWLYCLNKEDKCIRYSPWKGVTDA